MDSIPIELSQCDPTDAYQSSLAENIVLIADMLEAVRDQSNLLGETEMALFAAGVRDAVLAFGRTTITRD